MIINRNPNEHGIFLLELMVVIAIMGIVSVWVMQDAVRESEEIQAKRLGVFLTQYVNASRAYLADNATTIAAYGSPVVKTGASWLKHTSCTGSTSASKAYLPCSFPSGLLPLSASNITATLQSGVGSTAEIIIKTGTIQNAGVTREDLAGVALMAAEGSPMTGPSVLTYTVSTTFNHGTGTDAGKVLATISNAPSTDAWLRVDGSNAMAADLNMGGKNLNSVADISSSGNITTTAGNITTTVGNITTDLGYIRAAGDGTSTTDPKAPGTTIKLGSVVATGGNIRAIARPNSASNGVIGGNVLASGGHIWAKRESPDGLTTLHGGNIFTMDSSGVVTSYTVKTYVVSSGSLINKPLCRSNLTPAIKTAVRSTFNTSASTGIGGFYSTPSSVSSTQWQVLIYNRLPGGAYASAGGTILVITSCI